jgi:hypothetical protein
MGGDSSVHELTRLAVRNPLRARSHGMGALRSDG